MSLWRRLVAWFQRSKKPKPGSIRVAPPLTKLARGASARLRAIVYTKQGDVMPNTAPSSWKSDNTAVATVDNNGLVTGVAPGTCGVTALLNSLVSNVVAVTVTAPVPASIVVSPSSVSVTAGKTVQLTATVTDDTGQPI